MVRKSVVALSASAVFAAFGVGEVLAMLGLDGAS